jgi:putative toxin-antitoxin system antitoxin component (TIGR02293 family)
MASSHVQIRALAEDVFADPEKADLWLNEPLPILGGKTPLQIARSTAGALIVTQMLAKIDWGAAT